MGKGDRKSKKGKIIKGSYGKSRMKDIRNRNFISINQLRRWSIERLFVEIGQFDFTITLVFKNDSDSFNKFGNMITGQLYYTKNERKLLKSKINSGIKNETDGYVLFTTILKDNLTKEQINSLATTGFMNTDVIDLSYYGFKHNPTYFQKKGKKLEEPIKITVPDDCSYKESYQIILGLFKKRIYDGDDLIDFEKLEMMAIQKALKINDETPIFNFDDLIKERKIEFDFLVEEVLWWIEEIDEHSAGVLKNKSEMIKRIIDYEFNLAGINPDNPSEILKHKGLYSGLLQIGMMYKDEIVLYHTNPKIVLNFKGFMHVAFRHCNVCNVGPNNLVKSRIPYELADLKGLIKSCLFLLVDEINNHFQQYPDKRFSRFGSQLIRYNGDYFEIHINTKGIIETFYNHEK